MLVTLTAVQHLCCDTCDSVRSVDRLQPVCQQRTRGKQKAENLLGDEQDVDCTKVKFIVERQRSQTVVRWMYTCVQLDDRQLLVIFDHLTSAP